MNYVGVCLRLSYDNSGVENSKMHYSFFFFFFLIRLIEMLKINSIEIIFRHLYFRHYD